MKPVIAECPAQPYVAIRAQVTMQTMDSMRHTGHPDELIDVTASLREWATQEGLTWDFS